MSVLRSSRPSSAQARVGKHAELVPASRFLQDAPSEEVQTPGFRPPSRRLGPLPGSRALEERLAAAAAGPASAAVPGGTPGDPHLFDDYPWSAVGKVFVGRRQSDGTIEPVSEGSGCMIGRRMMLTASHVVPWDLINSGDWVVEFAPGYYNHRRLGVGSAFVVGWYGTVDEGEVGEIFGRDYVVCGLNEPIGDDVGWLPVTSMKESRYDDFVYTSVGYPGDVQDGEVACIETGLTIRDIDNGGTGGKQLETRLYGGGGWSGGPLWATIDGQVKIVGVHTGDETDGLDPRRTVHSGGGRLVDFVKYGLGHYEEPWQWLGGTFSAPPVVDSWAPNRLDILGLGTDRSLFQKTWDGSQWLPSPDGWQWLGGHFKFPPKAVSWAPNRLDLFGVGQDDAMYHKAWDGSQWWPSHDGWEFLGGVFTSPPAVVSWAPNRLDVFGLSTDHSMFQKTWDGTQWLPSNEDWQWLGGTFTSPPAVVSWAPNRLDVFGLGTDHSMFQKTWDGSQWLPSAEDWQWLGGTFSSPPAVVSWAPNRLDVFGLGTDRSLFQKTWDGSQWLPSFEDWQWLGGRFKHPPAVVSWAPNRLDLFGVGDDNAMYHKAWDGSQWWPSHEGWEWLGGSFTSPPAVASWAPNRLDIFALGEDQALYQKTWDGTRWLPE